MFTNRRLLMFLLHVVGWQNNKKGDNAVVMKIGTWKPDSNTYFVPGTHDNRSKTPGLNPTTLSPKRSLYY